MQLRLYLTEIERKHPNVYPNVPMAPTSAEGAVGPAVPSYSGLERLSVTWPEESHNLFPFPFKNVFIVVKYI